MSQVGCILENSAVDQSDTVKPILENDLQVTLQPENNYSRYDKEREFSKEEELMLEEKIKNRLRQKIKWSNVFLLLFIHAFALYFIVFYRFFEGSHHPKSILFAIVYGYFSSFGITAGVHRFYTHKSFKAKKPLEILLLLQYSMTGINPVYEWVRDHRIHHKYSDTDADPHNAARGFFFSHCGWLLMTKHPEVLRKGAKVDMSDITSNPLVQTYTKYYAPLTLFFSFILPAAIPMIFWNESLWYSFLCVMTRYAGTINSIWLVNSAAHLYGTRPYDSKIGPRQNRLVSLLVLGEGWHNYHHVFPWDYKSDEFGLRINPTTAFLDFFAKIGWAYDLKSASDQIIKTTAQNHGDSTHPIFKPKAL